MSKTTVPRAGGTEQQTAYGPCDPCGPAGEWLASAAPDPERVRGEWHGTAGLALIPLGRVCDAVRVPERIVHLVTGSADATVVSERLATHLPGGAVIRDAMYGHYYCLVPPGTSDSWACPAAECLGDSAYLGMPPTDRSVPTRYDSYWIRPLTRPGDLCSARDVLSLVVMGACLADAQDDSGDGDGAEWEVVS